MRKKTEIEKLEIENIEIFIDSIGKILSDLNLDSKVTLTTKRRIRKEYEESLQRVMLNNSFKMGKKGDNVKLVYEYRNLTVNKEYMIESSKRSHIEIKNDIGEFIIIPRLYFTPVIKSRREKFNVNNCPCSYKETLPHYMRKCTNLRKSCSTCRVAAESFELD